MTALKRAHSPRGAAGITALAALRTWLGARTYVSSEIRLPPRPSSFKCDGTPSGGPLAFIVLMRERERGERRPGMPRLGNAAVAAHIVLHILCSEPRKCTDRERCRWCCTVKNTTAARLDAQVVHGDARLGCAVCQGDMCASRVLV